MYSTSLGTWRRENNGITLDTVASSFLAISSAAAVLGGRSSHDSCQNWLCSTSNRDALDQPIGGLAIPHDLTHAIPDGYPQDISTLGRLGEFLQCGHLLEPGAVSRLANLNVFSSKQDRKASSANVPSTENRNGSFLWRSPLRNGR